ncbi:MAG TPA: hypothetical protein VHV75_06335 [Solirubrobacteraceae bacterium]|jgi:hypothetical protein|nr:hypothetical protein [Solirubrobacteraceae bacterium]
MVFPTVARTCCVRATEGEVLGRAVGRHVIRQAEIRAEQGRYMAAMCTAFVARAVANLQPRTYNSKRSGLASERKCNQG